MNRYRMKLFNLKIKTMPNELRLIILRFVLNSKCSMHGNVIGGRY